MKLGEILYGVDIVVGGGEISVTPGLEGPAAVFVDLG
jgi:hypothetical protein